MNKNKKLQSGFTLVELIVVVALMAIVFGALMNVIKPTNRFFNESEAFKDEVMISAGLTNALGDEVRYATNVLVLQNYVGVPYLSSDNQFAGLPDVEFDSVIMIDNQHLRGYCLSDYVRNGTAARRKGATGQIARFTLNGLGVDFSNCSLLYSEPYYADYKYEFTATGNTDENGLGYIDFGITMYDYQTTETQAYLYNDMKYDSSEFLYLKNINLKDSDGYRLYVKDFGGSVNNDDYIGFDRTPADSSFTDSQRQYFNGSDPRNVYTYIFYFKGVSVAPADTVTLNFDPAEGGSSVYSANVIKGRECKVTPPAYPEAGYDTETVGGTVFTRTFAGWESTTNPGTVYTNDQISSYIALADETFVARYILAGATYNVSFYSAAGSPIGSTVTVNHGDSVTPPTITVPSGYDGYIWIYKGSANSEIPDSDFNYVTRNIEAEPYFYNNYTVGFYEEDGATLIDSQTVKTGFSATPIAVPEKTGYTGEWVWVKNDGTEAVPDFGVISEDMKIVARYTALPVDVPNLTISNTRSNPNEWWKSTVEFEIKNEGTVATSSFKITVPMSEIVTSVELWSWSAITTRGATVTSSGKDVIINGSGVSIAPGESISVGFYVEPGKAVHSGDPFTTDVS